MRNATFWFLAEGKRNFVQLFISSLDKKKSNRLNSSVVLPRKEYGMCYPLVGWLGLPQTSLEKALKRIYFFM